MIFSPITGLTCVLVGAALLLVLSAIGRRFGWKGQALSLVLLGFGQTARERVWFGEFIPALTFEPSLVSTFVSASIMITTGVTALLVMRLISGPDASRREP